MLTFDDGFLNPSFADAVFHDTNRLSTRDVRELQDQHNVNVCDECDTWFDSDDIPQDQALTILSETEFLETYVF
jgi:hypothetical protein